MLSNIFKTSLQHTFQNHIWLLICSLIGYYCTSHSSPNYSSLFILIVHTLNTLLVHTLTWFSSEHRTMLNLPIPTLFISEIMTFFPLFLQLSSLKLASGSLGVQSVSHSSWKNVRIITQILDFKLHSWERDFFFPLNLVKGNITLSLSKAGTM